MGWREGKVGRIVTGLFLKTFPETLRRRNGVRYTSYYKSLARTRLPHTCTLAGKKAE